MIMTEHKKKKMLVIVINNKNNNRLGEATILNFDSFEHYTSLQQVSLTLFR